LPQLFPNLLPVVSLPLPARAYITAELLAETLDLKKAPTFGVSADADTAGPKIFPPQYVIEHRPNTTGQIPGWGLNWGTAPGVHAWTEGVHEFT
jgi:hypothetical protein